MCEMLSAAKVRSLIESSALLTASTEVNTASICPPAGRWPIKLPRWLIKFSPSCHDMTPATHAAAYWPTLCPNTASGWNPQLCISFAKPICTAKMAG